MTALTDAVNELLETSLSTLYSLRLLDQHWDVLDEDVQTAILLGIDSIDRALVRMAYVADTGLSAGIEVSEVTRNLLRRI